LAFEALAAKALEALRAEPGPELRWTGCAGGRDGEAALPLAQIVAAHRGACAAEELYRSVVERAPRRVARMERIPPTELLTRAAKAAGVRPPELERRLAALGKASGPPWTKEQKECALAAWALLG
jgi:hypothetical protein